MANPSPDFTSSSSLPPLTTAAGALPSLVISVFHRLSRGLTGTGSGWGQGDSLFASADYLYYQGQIRDAVAAFGIFMWFVMLAFCLSGMWVTRRRYFPPQATEDVAHYAAQRPHPHNNDNDNVDIDNHHHDGAAQLPGVSIIRPLKGIDPDLKRNLRSSFQQAYPRFEIVFTAESDDDPAIPVARALMEECPTIPARLIVSTQTVGINPKINNIIDGFESTQYDLVWMCDSNVYTDPGCLARSVRLLDNSPSNSSRSSSSNSSALSPLLPPPLPVGIIHHLVLATQPASFGAWLEVMFINTVHAKMYLAINATGAASCVVGKSNVYDKRQLAALGGLKAFSAYMAEDNTIAQAFWKRGWKHRMTSDRAQQSLGRMSLQDYFVRRIRWTRTRKYNVTFATIVEPFTESIVCGLLAAYGLYHYFRVAPGPFLVAHWIAWFLSDLAIFRNLHHGRMGGRPSSLHGGAETPLWYWAGIWLCRELFALPLYIYAVTGNTVAWRGRQFKLSLRGTITPLEAKS